MSEMEVKKCKWNWKNKILIHKMQKNNPKSKKNNGVKESKKKKMFFCQRKQEICKS